jgi:hypothetical protein
MLSVWWRIGQTSAAGHSISFTELKAGIDGEVHPRPTTVRIVEPLLAEIGSIHCIENP